MIVICEKLIGARAVAEKINGKLPDEVAYIYTNGDEFIVASENEDVEMVFPLDLIDQVENWMEGKVIWKA